MRKRGGEAGLGCCLDGLDRFSWVLNRLRMLWWLTLCVEGIKAYVSCFVDMVLQVVSKYEELVDDVAD